MTTDSTRGVNSAAKPPRRPNRNQRRFDAAQRDALRAIANVHAVAVAQGMPKQLTSRLAASYATVASGRPNVNDFGQGRTAVELTEMCRAFATAGDYYRRPVTIEDDD